MRKLSISNKILGGFGFILIMCIAIVFLAKSNLDRLSRNIFFMQNSQLPILKKTHEMSGQFRRAAVYLQKFANGDTRPDNKQSFESSRDSCLSCFQEIYGALKAGLGKDADKSKQPIEDVQAAVVEFFEIGAHFMDPSAGESDAERPTLTGPQMLELIDEKIIEIQGQSEGIFSFFEISEGKRIQRELDRMIKTLDILMKILPVVIVLFGIGFTYFISTGIAGPLQKITFSMGQAERGILETRIDVRSQDEFQRVADSFNNMIEGIRQIIVKVIETSQDLATSSQELSSASVESAATLVDISKNVNEINTSAVEVSTNLEKTSISIENVANSAAKVASLAETAVEAAAVTTDAANSGGQTVKKSVEMIGKIKESVDIATQVILDLNAASMQIGEIVNTITSIASQTNLLALNAAIEAARAGEQGKGFTVVADEVRKLAEESAEAAEAIGTRIENILTKTQNAVDSMQLGRSRVDEGIRVVRDVSISLDNITKNIDGVNTKIKEISRISSEQSSSSHIMARTVEDITKLLKSTSERMNVLALSVEQQTATVSEISGSTEDLARLADELQLLVSRFTVHGQEAAAAREKEEQG